MEASATTDQGRVRLNFDVDFDVREQFREFASSLNMSMSELLRDFVHGVVQSAASTEAGPPLPITTWDGTRPHALNGTQWQTASADAPLPWWLRSIPALPPPSAAYDAESPGQEPW